MVKRLVVTTLVMQASKVGVATRVAGSWFQMHIAVAMIPSVSGFCSRYEYISHTVASCRCVLEM